MQQAAFLDTRNRSNHLVNESCGLFLIMKLILMKLVSARMESSVGYKSAEVKWGDPNLVPYLMQIFRLTSTYLRNGNNLLKVAGNDPTINATAPRTTATIAVSTKRSFQLYFISQ